MLIILGVIGGYLFCYGLAVLVMTFPVEALKTYYMSISVEVYWATLCMWVGGVLLFIVSKRLQK